MPEQSTEARLSSLEKEVAELKQQLAERISFDGLRTDVKELSVRYQAHEEYVSDRLNTFEDHVNTRLDVAEDNNAARFAALQTGQQEQNAAIQGLVTEMREGFAHIIQTLNSGQQPRRND